MSLLKKAVTNGLPADVCVIGDSNVTNALHYTYRFANVFIKAANAALTIRNRFYDDTTNTWPAATTLASGGAGPIEFWHATRTGSQPTYFLGGKRATCIDAMPASPALYIIHHGPNSTAYTGTYSQRAQFMTLIEALKLRSPSTPILLVYEHPDRDDNLMAAVNTAQQAIVALYPDILKMDEYGFLSQPASRAVGTPTTSTPRHPLERRRRVRLSATDCCVTCIVRAQRRLSLRHRQRSFRRAARSCWQIRTSFCSPVRRPTVGQAPTASQSPRTQAL
ncbi:hypothetical protein IVA79_12825 [Bradyrhizobium sp. 138]|uniref:hypothetical protein n=1 Tax=Bradyrhizobium sp. 138 TaxID=2782615 RepID=UPI001FFA3C2B|nr:hypothetical protein [Bradyrhizobium sp. 138]MCK1734822.1 hypothetical protein [Bradyrhizobium sp. 138]